MTVSATATVAAPRRIQRRLRPTALHPDFATVDCAVALCHPSRADLLGGLALCPVARAATITAASAPRSLFEAAARALRAAANWRPLPKRSAGSLASAVDST